MSYSDVVTQCGLLVDAHATLSRDLLPGGLASMYAVGMG